MSTTLYYYKIYCNTDSQYEYIWSETEPTVCPVNNTHSVNLNSIAIENQLSENTVKIKEENVPTGEHFQAISVIVNGETGPDSVTDNIFTWPMPVSMFGMQFGIDETHNGDMATLSIAPNTIVGIILADCPTGATGVVCSQTVVDNIKVGYHVCLTNGVNVENCGRVISVNTNNNTIEWENPPATYAFSASSPTYVTMTIYMVYNYYFGIPGRYTIGDGKIGGSYLPAGTPVHVSYHNMGTVPKKLVAQLEYLY